MKKIFAFIVICFIAFPVFSQNNTGGIPPAKKQRPVSHKAPPSNPDYSKNAVKQSKKDMDKSIDKFQDPKYQDVIKQQNAKKAKATKGM